MGVVLFSSGKPSLYSRALQIYLILIGRAENRQTITYGELAERLGYAGADHNGAGILGPRLDPIMRWCLTNGLPDITTLVVSQRTGLPTLSSASNVGIEQQGVFELDWHAIFPPTEADLREPYGGAYAEMPPNATRREQKAFRAKQRRRKLLPPEVPVVPQPLTTNK
jgi:hypothetical protein